MGRSIFSFFTKKKKMAMARSISYITSTQLLPLHRRPNIAIIDVRYNIIDLFPSILVTNLILYQILVRINPDYCS